MYLKTLCNQLSKRNQALDVMLQFASPERILRPLCLFLHDWRYEDTQGTQADFESHKPLTSLGEYQPVYDEFGAILVLVLAFVHRYGLSYHDLGIGHDSFVAQLIERGHVSIDQDDMTEEQKKHLGNWLKGLYDSDKEALGNDVFACRPQDFYLIVPTLFRRTVVACAAEVLSLDTAKGGLECGLSFDVCVRNELMEGRSPGYVSVTVPRGRSDMDGRPCRRAEPPESGRLDTPLPQADSIWTRIWRRPGHAFDHYFDRISSPREMFPHPQTTPPQPQRHRPPPANHRKPRPI